MITVQFSRITASSSSFPWQQEHSQDHQQWSGSSAEDTFKAMPSQAAQSD